MQTYSIKGIERRSAYCRLLLTIDGAKDAKNVYLTNEFCRDMVPGQKITEYHSFKSYYGADYPVGYMWNNNMYIALYDLPDYKIRNFPRVYGLGMRERAAFNVALIRALRAKNIRPGARIATNLARLIEREKLR